MPKLDVLLDVKDEFAVLGTNISCKEFAHAFANVTFCEASVAKEAEETMNFRGKDGR